MSRTALVALGIGLLAAAAIVLLGLSGTAVMPSYLGAWLAILALPLGALPVVMGSELFDVAETRLMAALRRLVAVMPIAAALAVPVLLRHGTLYPSLHAMKHGLAAWWMTPGFFVVRAVVFLVVWTALSSVFARPVGRQDRRRTAFASLGLILHAVMGTLAADDWAQEVEPSFNASSFGLLLIAAQCSIAVCLAVVMAVSGRRETDAAHALASDRRDLDATGEVGIALAVLLASWAFLTFTQYLVVWSANLPKEVIWYQQRASGLGLVAEYSSAVLCALALVALLSRGLSRHAAVLAWVAAALLVMHGLEMFWLVTPAFRGSFSLTLADLAALAGAAGLGIGSALFIGERTDRGRASRGAA